MIATGDPPTSGKSGLAAAMKYRTWKGAPTDEKILAVFPCASQPPRDRRRLADLSCRRPPTRHAELVSVSASTDPDWAQDIISVVPGKK